MSPRRSLQRRSSQSVNGGLPALTTQPQPPRSAETGGNNGNCVGGWRQWQPQQLAGHRTLRIELARHFQQNGCQRHGA